MGEARNAEPAAETNKEIEGEYSRKFVTRALSHEVLSMQVNSIRGLVVG